ncbi:MAG TPA: hypothetical protein VGH65_09080 [Verrucomicrobiaceae bacterium]|jgi:hypothetical protein
MASANRERFWQSASSTLARRINFCWWLERWTVWLMSAAIGGSVAVLLTRWMRPEQLPSVWIALAVFLSLGALLAWCTERRRFESSAMARVRLEDSLGLKTRLSAAAAQVGEWPAEVEKIAWPLRWQWQRPLAVLLFALGMLFVSSKVPVSEGAGLKKRIIERPSAVKDVEQWVQELRKEEAVEKKSADEVERKIADLLKRPAENWYEHGSLEAAGNLREQTAAELRELAENLAEAQRAASALQAMGDSAPQAVKDSLGAGLEQAASNLAAGGMKPNEQLLQQLQNMKASDLKNLSKEQMKALADQMKKNGETLEKCLGQCQNFDKSGIPTYDIVEGKEGKNGPHGDGKPGRGGANRGRGDAEMFFKRDETNLASKKSEAIPTELDFERAAPGDVVAVTDGKHDVDQNAYQGPKQGGAIQSAGDGGSAVWQNSLTPAEREVLKRYFK